MVGLFALSEWNAKSFSVLMKLKEINDDIPKILEKINVTGIAISGLYEVFCEKDIVRTSILIKGLAFRESLRKRLKNAINVANGNYDILTILFYLYKKRDHSDQKRYHIRVVFSFTKFVLLMKNESGANRKWSMQCSGLIRMFF